MGVFERRHLRTWSGAPGAIEAIAYRDGREIARRRLATLGGPAALRLQAQPFGGGAGRGDLTFITVDIVDAEGRLIPDLEQEVAVSVQGAGELLAFGSANPLAVGSYQSGTARSWRGRALAIIRGSGKAGKTVITARSAGLKGGMVAVRLA